MGRGSPVPPASDRRGATRALAGTGAEPGPRFPPAGRPPRSAPGAGRAALAPAFQETEIETPAGAAPVPRPGRERAALPAAFPAPGSFPRDPAERPRRWLRAGGRAARPLPEPRG